MKIIASADKNWGIGHNGKLLAHVSGDMKFFKSKTYGNVVVLGRKTLDTFPGKKPLEGRQNIILSSDRGLFVDGAEVVHSIDELMEFLCRYDSDSVYVIGGGRVYHELLPYCDTAYITKFDKQFEADTHICSFDKNSEWFLQEESDLKEEKGIFYKFCTYKRKYK